MAKAKKQEKLNDKVNVKKNKKGVDIDKYVSDEAKEVRRFIIILLSIIYLVLIVLFSYIYTLLQFRPADISENLQKNGGYIPGIRPGVETKNYIKSVLIKITTFGSLFLVVIAALPILFSNYSNVQNANITLGGTGILIVVGVALETYKQIESVLTQKEYKRRF